MANIVIWAPPLLLAITFHEAAHGFAAYRYGDDTAKRLGRMTLNPIAHIDPFGTVLLPALLSLLPGGLIFGYAKPVPVQINRLRHPRWDMAKVAIAGPAMNFVLALASALILLFAKQLPSSVAVPVEKMLEISIFFNILLGVFNLLPVPPLDGGRVIAAFLPKSATPILNRLETLGIFVVLGVFFLLPRLLAETGIKFDPFGTLILKPTLFFSSFLLDFSA
ncbi:MAG: site-2 protease family protein [Pseudomonadota bacterium]